jgi:predicted AlkP superfamily phosphohydrolase/phosphomutase
MPRRVIVWGVDGFVLPLAEHLVQQGHLPHIARLLREGAATRLLPYVSTWGPINWMSFMTGAPPGSTWPGRVAVPGMNAAEPGHRNAYKADTLWQAVDRQGGATATLAYPATWPPLVRHGIVAMPDGASTNLPPVALARPARYMTPGLAERYRQPPGTRAGWIPLTARGHRRPRPGLPVPQPPKHDATLPAPNCLETAVPLALHGAQEALHLPLLYSPGQRRAWLYSASKGALLAETAEGTWSEWFALTTPTGERGWMRYKLLELDDAGREVALCHSALCPEDQFAYPREIEADLLSALGPYSSGSSADLRPSDPFWRTAIEEATAEADWLVDSAEFLTERDDWTLWSTVFRAADTANHGCLAFVDPERPFSGGAETDAAWEILRAAYGVVDRAIGRLMALADDDMVIALASDHGAAVNDVTCDVYNLLVEAGLLALRQGPHGPVVDWERTRAYVRPTRSGSEVFVNLQGREPHGIVPQDEYESLQRRLVDLLLDWKEPQTGGRAVAMALTRRDAALIGYWGDEAGDVQFIYNAGYVWGELPQGTTIARTAIPSVNHGPQIPTAERGLATNMGMLALWGAGIQSGYRRDENRLGPAHMADAAPTLARLLGCPPPRQSTGAVLRDMLDE